MRASSYIHARDLELEVEVSADRTPSRNSDFVSINFETEHGGHGFSIMFWSQKQTMLFLSQLQYQVDKLIKERTK